MHPHRPSAVFLNHIGFLCDARKTVRTSEGPWSSFLVQDMGRSAAEALGGYENWETIFEGSLRRVETQMGTWLEGDFSAITRPGIYRIILPGLVGHSWQFAISDGIFHPLLSYWLDFVHDRRSGDFENDWRGPSHLDDAVRKDTHALVDLVGGWYDAGDLRQWMTMTHLPALGFLDLARQLRLSRSHFLAEGVSTNDYLTETAWAVQFILKMQDPDSGMIWEEIGGGGEGRRLPGMEWWYDNHAGCYADNSQNYFSNNIPDDGDDRVVRTDYNPIVQYTNAVILLRAAAQLQTEQPTLAAACYQAADRVWAFLETVLADGDPFHRWTSVRSWRLILTLERYILGQAPLDVVHEAIDILLETYEPAWGWWYMTHARKDCYRGILHAAQPWIALGRYLEVVPDAPRRDAILAILRQSWQHYAAPMRATNAFGIMPYGQWLRPATDADIFRRFDAERWFRFFMPDHSPQRVNHGLAGHWTSWAHGFALLSSVVGDPDWASELRSAAWDQLYWLLGNNPLDTCMVSGIGYRNPMPHSRFHGYMVGGFCVGPRGDAKDNISIDLDARAEWNSTEYWNTPVGNATQALAHLLPPVIGREKKLGFVGGPYTTSVH
ncbi:MAG: hypothetical protein OHK0039_12660 [Bacteroidia bacterium]